MQSDSIMYGSARCNYGPALETIAHIGKRSFGDALLNTFTQVSRAQHLTVVLYRPPGDPLAIVVNSQTDRRLIERLSIDYTAGFHTRDPNRALLDSPAYDTGIRLLRRKVNEFDSSYRSHFFADSQVVEKLTLATRLSETTISLNLYSTHVRGGFEDSEVDRLVSLAPITVATIMRHMELCAANDTFSDSVALQVAHNLNVKLSRREIQVMTRILQGYSSEAIALDLGIAISSVKTFRKSLYRKLNIVSQAQLFGIAYSSGGQG